MTTPVTDQDPAAEPMAVEFDFETRKEQKIPARQAAVSCAAGKFCWVDLDERAPGVKADEVLRLLGVNDHAISEAIGPDVDGRHDVYEDRLDIAAAAAEPPGGDAAACCAELALAE